MNPLYLTAAGTLVSAIALAFAIPALIRRAGLEPVATLPIEAEHRLNLRAGALVLHLAGPLGKRGLGGLSFALVDAAGVLVPGSPIVMRTQRSSGRWGVLLAVRRFELATDGAHRLAVTGIPADPDLSDCAMVLARPQGAGLVVSILGVVAAGVMLVVCSVLGLILWLSPTALTALPSAGA